MIITILNNILYYIRIFFFQGFAFSLILTGIYLFFAVQYFKGKESEKSMAVYSVKKAVLFAPLMFYGYVVLGITLFSRSEGYTSEVNLRLFSTFGESFASRMYVYQNILLFIPLAILLYFFALPFQKLHWALITGIVCSTLIELMQYMTHWGKVEIDDVFNNTVGMMIGYWSCRFMVKIKSFLVQRK